MHKILHYAFVIWSQIKWNVNLWGWLVANYVFPDLIAVVAMQTYKQKPLKEPQWVMKKLTSWMQQGPSLGTQYQLQLTAKKLYCSLGLAGSNAKEEGLEIYLDN